ncbi:hypothetical protein [Pseudarthrobacter sp. NS4]|uniref:hypothetical protein n=1 Tax=Pseudarthrobacter sp. NS4 TaxID=2973976 RepID=UPI002162532C|nr:hypothetical protein [Pseudarthrobacter sp. NS4]
MPGIGQRALTAHAHATRTTTTGSFVYSHTSAARLHGVYLWNVDSRIHVSQPVRASNDRHACEVVCRTAGVDEYDTAVVGGLRTTSLERTVVDSCLLLPYRQSLILMDHSLRLGADRDFLEHRAAALDGRRGARTLRRVLSAADPLAESPGETLTRELLVRFKLELPVPQFEVRTQIGRHRLDFAWPKRKVALEYDGRSKYFDYHPTNEVLFEERRREKHSRRMAGPLSAWNGKTCLTRPNSSTGCFGLRTGVPSGDRTSLHFDGSLPTRRRGTSSS